MEDRRPEDHARQASRPEPAYSIEVQDNDLLGLEIRNLSPAHVAQLLREAARITGTRPIPEVAWFVDSAHAVGDLRGGRQFGQKSGTAPEALIKAEIVRLATLDWPLRRIATYLNEHFPPDQYERRKWNHTTVGRWLNEARASLEQNGTEIDEPGEG